MRCISWVAVSSKAQVEKESPIEQRESNRLMIEALGGVEVAILEVPGQSREIISFEDACKRIEAYAQLRAMMDARSADLIVFRDMSRLGRTAALVNQVVSYCHEAGIAVYSRSAPPNSLIASEQAKSEGAIIMLSLEGALSQVEMMRLRERNIMGMAGRVKSGKFYNNIPYGYRKVHEPDGSETYAIVEPQAKTIRLIFRLYLEDDLGYLRIADYLNGLGIISPSGVSWTVKGTIKILGKALRYAGWAEGNKTGNRVYTDSAGEVGAYNQSSRG